MSLTLLVWLSAYALFAVLAFVRPVWGIALYFLSFFGDPASWWWGAPIVSIRWNLMAGIIALVAVVLNGKPWLCRHRTDWLSLLMIGILLNATIVHFALAPNLVISGRPYFLLVKFVLLYFLIKSAVLDRSDLITTIMIFVVALGHLGYEVKINDAGRMEKGRLEAVGPPTANNSNLLGSLNATLLPLFGVVLFNGSGWQRLVVLVASPFAVNVLLLTKSRGALLSLAVAAPVFLTLAPPKARRVAFLIVLLGGVGVLALMRDQSITERFFTTFNSAEQRDSSAASRLDYWKAGLRLVRDRPFGSGGDGYSKVYASRYLAGMGHHFDRRSVHNGWINEACQWGIQGWFLRTSLFAVAAWIALGRARRLNRIGQRRDALLGAALVAGLAAFCTGSIFSDALDNEWGYWMVAIIAAYDNVFAGASPSQFGQQLYRVVRTEPVESAHFPDHRRPVNGWNVQPVSSGFAS